MTDKEKITELENENTLLKVEIASLENALDIETELNYDAEGERELILRENAKLKQQIKDMRCCGNCIWGLSEKSCRYKDSCNADLNKWEWCV